MTGLSTWQPSLLFEHGAAPGPPQGKSISSSSPSNGVILFRTRDLKEMYFFSPSLFLFFLSVPFTALSKFRPCYDVMMANYKAQSCVAHTSGAERGKGGIRSDQMKLRRTKCGLGVCVLRKIDCRAKSTPPPPSAYECMRAVVGLNRRIG